MVDYATKINSSNPQTFIQWHRTVNRSKSNPGTWTKWQKINFSKYQIKESDMRIKTMTFTSPTYIDLTQGQVIVGIISEAHENFYGIILSVEEDKTTGMYNYQCQDSNRALTEKYYSWSVETSVYDNIKAALKTTKTKNNYYPYYHDMDALLLPIEDYKQPEYDDIQSFNPMETKVNAIWDKVSVGDRIRSLLFQNNVFVDFYFPSIYTSNNVTAPAIEPYSKDKWLGEGLYFTTPELAEYTMKFDTTNIITNVWIKPSEKFAQTTSINKYSSEELLGVDLTAFFGRMQTTIDNPVKQTSTTTTSGGVGVGTDSHIVIDSDNIYGKSKDRQMLEDCATALRNAGYTVTISGIGPNYHVWDLNKLENGGCLFVIVGGLCAGTFVDMCSTYYTNALKAKNAKVVLGCLSPPITRQLDTITWLERAHDDTFSESSFTGLANPGKYLKDHGINYVYGSNGTELGTAFAGGSSSTSTTTTLSTSTSDATTSDGSVTIDSNSATNVELEKQAAMEKMTESVRDLLTFKMKIPGGSPELKKLHTNSFIWTELPERFSLANFSKISDAMKSTYTRYTGYELNRWYVEGVTITQDSNGLWFELTLNPFASSYSTYTNILKSAQNAYTQATTSTNDSSSSSSTTTTIAARTDGKTDCSTTFSLSCGHGNISSLQNKAESTLAQGAIGRTGTNYANWIVNNGLQGKPKEVYKKLAAMYSYSGYYDNLYYKCAEQAFNHPNNWNCAECARMLKCCMDIVGQPCVIYHVPGHYMNGVLLNGRWETVDLCYRSGRYPQYQTAGWNK